jgi:hypothetical protein
MSAFLRALKPLKSAATAFFSHDLTLRRGERGLEVGLAERSGEPRRSPAQQREHDRRRGEARLLAQMQDELAALLDESAGIRRTMRALAMFDEAFAAEGLAALDNVPLPVLTKALEQFESLVSNWSPVGLATLRSKMSVAAGSRQRREADAAAANTRSGGPRSRRDTTARDSGPSVSVGMQQSRQDLEAADVQEVELEDAARLTAQLSAAYAPVKRAAPAPIGAAAASNDDYPTLPALDLDAPALPHPQAASAADDEAAALAAAYAALGGSFNATAPDSVRG